MTEPIASAKLTKNFLMALAEGVFLVSNGYHAPETPAYAAKVAPLQNREAQWRGIKESGADARLCEVFQDWESYLEDRLTIRNLPSRT